ncbi:3'-5' exonuclease [Chondromyces apiculatus]|nr:3'-5' exonuclease [Chondromyces apiculatus]
MTAEAPRNRRKNLDGTAQEEPPLGPPWDLPLASAPLLFVDLEMTGLHPATDRIIEICAQRVRGDVLEASLTSLVRPESEVFGNSHVHGIQPGDLANAPPFSALCEPLEALAEGAIVVAHAADWDVAFLEAELARAGRPRRFSHFLDSLVLARRAFAFTSHSLASLCREFGIVREREHRAEDDVLALRAIFGRIVTELSPATPRHLWRVRVGERRARPELVEAAKEAAARGEPVRLRYRPAGRAAQELTVRITGVRTDLDPPLVLGYLLPSRSRRELRADRILALEPLHPSRPGGTDPDGAARGA